MALKILIGLAVVLVAFLLFVAAQPATFRVERSTTIAAPPEPAFARVNDFHAWASWSPWEKLDPEMTRTFSGPSSGVGASYGWSGSGKAGAGRMTIEHSDAAQAISIKLEFKKPFRATNTASFAFVLEGNGNTKVTWAMTGTNNFMSKAIHLFFDMDKLVGGDFERGLANLKQLSEQDVKSGVVATSAH